MITLTPEEAREYEQNGPIAAIKAFRHRTNLGLAESKRCVDAWAASGRPVAADGKPFFESQTMEKLSEALTRLREAENAIYRQRRTAIEIALRVGADAVKYTGDLRETWYKACHAVAAALGNELQS